MVSLLEAIPPANAVIVAVVGLLLVLGVREIRRDNVERHRALMVTATSLFALFLVLYLVRMIVHGPTSFAEQNPSAPAWASTFYYTFLGVHMLLALATTLLVPVVLYRASEKRFEDHRRLARKVYPMWLISIAMGIAVYFMLFQIWA